MFLAGNASPLEEFPARKLCVGKFEPGAAPAS